MNYQNVKMVALGSGASEFLGHLDSGAEITVIWRSVLNESSPLTGGKITLRGAFREQVVADLAYVPLYLVGTPEKVEAGTPDAGILCAITDKLAVGINALIHPDAQAKLLEETPEVSSAPPVGKTEGRRDHANWDGLVAATLSQQDRGYSEPRGGEELSSEASQREQIRRAQLAHPTLLDS